MHFISSDIKIVREKSQDLKSYHSNLKVHVFSLILLNNYILI